VRVTWSQRARRELDAQQRYIAQDQPAAATRSAARIVAATDRLAMYPRYGRAAAWDVRHRLRELPVAATPYVVIYAIDTTADEVIVVRIVHGSPYRGSDEA
jgi:plasmid stabilization system protein ParE